MRHLSFLVIAAVILPTLSIARGDESKAPFKPGKADVRGQVSSVNRLSSRSASCPTDSDRSRTAASSMPSGRPSSARHSRATSRALSSVIWNAGSTAVARSRNSRTESYRSRSRWPTRPRRPHPRRRSHSRLRCSTFRRMSRSSTRSAWRNWPPRARAPRRPSHAVKFAVAARSRIARRAPVGPVRDRPARRSSPVVASSTARSRVATTSGPRRR